MLGYEFDWWPGRSGFDLIHPDDLPRAAGVFAELLDNPGETYAEVLRTRNADGHWELIEYTAVNRLDDPLVESIVITTRNVTEFTQAEAMLADEAKILELIARGAPLEQTLDTIATMVDYHTGGDSGVFLFSADGTRLTSCAAPSMPDELVDAARRGVRDPDRRADHRACRAGRVWRLLRGGRPCRRGLPAVGRLSRRVVRPRVRHA